MVEGWGGGGIFPIANGQPVPARLALQQALLGVDALSMLSESGRWRKKEGKGRGQILTPISATHVECVVV